MKQTLNFGLIAITLMLIGQNTKAVDVCAPKESYLSERRTAMGVCPRLCGSFENWTGNFTPYAKQGCLGDKSSSFMSSCECKVSPFGK